MLSVNEYVVVAVGLITGLCKLDEDPSDPVQDQDVALLELSYNVTVPLLQIGPPFVAPVEVGAAFTDTVTVPVLLQPAALTPVTV